MPASSAVRASADPSARTPAPAASGPSPSGAEGARRVLAVLQAFSSGRHTLTARDLAETTAIPLPSMYRYIALLRETGLLAGDDRGAYHLSPRLLSLARAAEAAESLIAIADPALRDLAAVCGETVILVRLFGRVPVCVHRVESPQQAAPPPEAPLHEAASPPEAPLHEAPLHEAPSQYARAVAEPGQSLPLDRGATGQVLLAGLPGPVRREYLAPLAQADPAAAGRLEEAVALTAARGWAVTEDEAGQGRLAVSVPVTDGRSTAAALTLPSVPASAACVSREILVGQLRETAVTLSRLIADAQRS